MSTDEERREDAKRESWESQHPLEQCPGCKHESLVVTLRLRATRIDPEAWTGYCECKRRNAEIAAGREQCGECGERVSDIHTSRCRGCGTYIFYQGKPDHATMNLFQRIPERCGPIDPPTEVCDCLCHCKCEAEW